MVYSLLHFLIFPMLIDSISNRKIIAIRFFISLHHNYIHINLGTPKQLIEEKIDQTMNYSLLMPSYSNSYIFDKSLTFQNHTSLININEKPGLVDHYSDCISFIDQNFTIPDFYFYYYNKKYKYSSFKVGFAFAYKFNDENYSIVHQLYNNKLIDARSYSFHSTYSSRGTIYFGGVSDEVATNYYKNECNVQSIDIFWGCSLTKVSIGDNYTYTYVNVHPSYFQVGAASIYAPVDFFLFLNETVLTPYFLKRHCVMEDEGLRCKDFVLEQIGKICFEFGKDALCYEADYLFDLFGYYKSFLILPNKKENNWIFGSIFIKPYITTFDYDKNTITFYSKSPFERIVDLSSSKLRIWLSSKSVICVISFIAGIIVCLSILYLYKWISLKRKKKQMRLVFKENKEMVKKFIRH